MLSKRNLFRVILPIMALMTVALVAAACGSDDDDTKEVIRFHDGQWETLWLNNAVAMYITENGYDYPVEQIQGTTGTMKVALPIGDLDVNMEMWRNNILDWYNEELANGNLVDLAGTSNNLANGSVGQILDNSAQGFYVPTYVIDANPGLVSVDDLPGFKELFTDPEDSDKGLLVNCIIGWGCQKIVRAKWFAYGLYESFNVLEPGSAGAIDANIKGAYEAGEPVLSYYWEPTKLIAELDMTMLEEPVWSKECQVALDAATVDEPYESEIGCAFPVFDVHTGVYSGLVDRASEVTTFLAEMYIGALALDDLTAWRNENDKEPMEAGIYWLQTNENIWSAWVPADVAEKVKAALDDEPA